LSSGSSKCFWHISKELCYLHVLALSPDRRFANGKIGLNKHYLLKSTLKFVAGAGV